MSEKVGIIGLWHLGCVLAASWSKLGHEVSGFDYDKKRIENLNNGIPPIYEPFLTDELKNQKEAKRLTFSNSINTLSHCDYIFLCYDTPVNDVDESDTTILEQSLNDVKSIMKNGAILIVSSQSPVGYCSTLRKILKAQNSTLELAYSPENLRLGEAIHCYLNPGRVILGLANDEIREKCVKLFNKITSDVIIMNLESSELVKHGINSFLAASIVFANNLSDICEKNNANIKDVVKGMKSDVRIGEKAYLSSGVGFSGGTLGRDLKVLDITNSKDKGHATLFGEIHKLNRNRKFSIADKIESITGGITNRTITILGLTYKPDTSTLRRSLPLEIVDILLSRKAIVKVFDPQADYSELTYKPEFSIAKDIFEAVNNSDLLVLLTDWSMFKQFSWESVVSMMASPKFYDTKNCLDEQEMIRKGFLYYSIGK